MLGQFKPVVFDPYRQRRSRWHLPPWALLLLSGIAAGALGLAILQERYLPPRLSAGESATLRKSYEQADAERTRLAAELDATTKQLQAALADKKTLGDDLAAARASVVQANNDVNAVIAALPPDPRGGTIEVRAGWFTAKGTTLNYNAVLTRERTAGKRLDAVLQMLATGDSARGTEVTVTLKPVAVSIGSQDVVRGSATLPDGFRPRQVSVQLLDRAGGKLLGMRVMLVK